MRPLTQETLEDQWQERALCAQTDPEAFFPEKGGSTREAKRICLGCEVRDECLDILKDWRGFLTVAGAEIIGDLADTAYNALSLRTVNYATDIPVADGNSISVGMAATTMMACPEDSQANEFSMQLMNAATFFVQDDHLFIDQAMDSGTMEFQPLS